MPGNSGPVMPPADKKSDSTDKKSDSTDKKQSRVEGDRARLVIELPADARLFIDDQPMKATSSIRSFQTPQLQSGATYYYILKVEVVRDSATRSETKRVLIKAGEEVTAMFTESSIASASGASNTASR
jgi:uncharacterized protein (TIGR03000 family)